MSQTVWSTAALYGNVSLMHGSSDADADAANAHAVSVKEAVSLALEHGVDVAPTTGARDPDAKASALRPFTGGEQGLRDLSRIVDLPPPKVRRAPTVTLHALQEWEGYVVDVTEGDFVARLVDLTAGSSHEEEEAVIPLDEVAEQDAHKVGPGSIFRWVIGYERSAAGTKKRVSQIVFRDLPAITGTDLRDGEAWAQETIRALDL